MLYYKVQTVDRVSIFLWLLDTSFLNCYMEDVKFSMKSLSNLYICTTPAESCSLLSWNVGHEVQKCEFLQIT